MLWTPRTSRYSSIITAVFSAAVAFAYAGIWSGTLRSALKSAARTASWLPTMGCLWVKALVSPAGHASRFVLPARSWTAEALIWAGKRTSIPPLQSVRNAVLAVSATFAPAITAWSVSMGSGNLNPVRGCCAKKADTPRWNPNPKEFLLLKSCKTAITPRQPGMKPSPKQRST